jgi:hypothetical protein
VTALVAGCGGNSASHASGTSSRCRGASAQAKRELPRLHADSAAISRARTHAATSRTTDRFIADIEHSHVSLTAENRLIDLAISGTLGKCHDCFEALEALRPIPSLARHACS